MGTVAGAKPVRSASVVSGHDERAFRENLVLVGPSRREGRVAANKTTDGAARRPYQPTGPTHEPLHRRRWRALLVSAARAGSAGGRRAAEPSDSRGRSVTNRFESVAESGQILDVNRADILEHRSITDRSTAAHEQEG